MELLEDTMLGVALVVDDLAKGPKLAFSFPLRHSVIPVAVGGDEPALSASPSADYFARLLRPKPLLCNRSFVLSIDRTAFYSFPILLSTASERPYRSALQLAGMPLISSMVEAPFVMESKTWVPL